MNITIDITPEQERFLRQFAENQCPGAPDNLGTAKPLHLVQTYEPLIVFDGGDHGDEKYYDLDTNEMYDTAKELVKASLPKDERDNVKSFDDALFEEINGHLVTNLNKYFEAYDVNAQAVSVIDQWRTVSYHFTLAEAKRYIKYQGHNLTNPRTYTVSCGYGNEGDYEPFWNVLMQIGSRLNNDKPKEDPHNEQA